MSIINDALKKAQKNLSSKKNKNILKPGIDQSQAISPLDSQHDGIAKGNKLKLLIICALFLIVLFMIIILVLILNKKPDENKLSPAQETTTETIRISQPLGGTKNTRTLSTPSNLIKSKQPLREKISIPQRVTIAPTEYSRTLSLDGIMMIENKMVALINGDAYEAGDAIFGMKVIKLTAETVEIKTNDGKILILSVRDK